MHKTLVQIETLSSKRSATGKKYEGKQEESSKYDFTAANPNYPRTHTAVRPKQQK